MGFLAMIIFGLSRVKLNSCFGFRAAHMNLGRSAYFLWTLGLILRMLGWLLAFDQEFSAGSQTLFFTGGACIALAGIGLAITSRVFEPTRESQRSHKFVRGAYAWLIAAGLMILWEPIQLRLVGAPFSHAYTGAIRHAVTVGFISQMILGFGCHVTARLNDLVERKMAPLWSAFLLLNLGNAARVALEVASNFTPSAFTPMGLTGFIELVGLGVWAYHVAGPMLVPKFRLRYVE
jgi:putative Mn2+ efflux pump MntP